MCAAVSQRGVLHHHANLGPNNTALLFTLFGRAEGRSRAAEVQCRQEKQDFPLVNNWFMTHPHLIVLYLLPHSSSLIPTKEIFLLQAPEDACGEVGFGATSR